MAHLVDDIASYRRPRSYISSNTAKLTWNCSDLPSSYLKVGTTHSNILQWSRQSIHHRFFNFDLCFELTKYSLIHQLGWHIMTHSGEDLFRNASNIKYLCGGEHIWKYSTRYDRNLVVGSIFSPEMQFWRTQWGRRQDHIIATKITFPRQT